MTDATIDTTGTDTEDILEFMKGWALGFSQVMEQLGNPLPAGLSLEPTPERKRETDVHFAVAIGGALHGELNVCVPRSMCAELLNLAGKPMEAETELTPEHQQALLEIFGQVAVHTAEALKQRWGEVQISVQPGAQPSWTVAVTGFIRTGSEQATRLVFELQVSSALAASLRAKLAAENRAPEDSVKIDRLMDVELEVALRFGGKRMLLGEILELGPGSVVELDRRVQEPIDLLLDGRLLARGEVVVVDGNYGIRVTEVTEH